MIPEYPCSSPLGSPVICIIQPAFGNPYEICFTTNLQTWRLCSLGKSGRSHFHMAQGREAMRRATKCSKRPCRICRRWFAPNPKLKDRQMTCGDPACKREWHKKACRQWNRENRDYFRANYLQKMFAARSGTTPRPHTMQSPGGLSKTGLPLEFAQEAIGLQHLIIIEYLAQLLVRRFQEALRSQLVVNERKISQFTDAPA